MRVLLDQGLSVWAASTLRTGGMDIVHVSEIGMAAAADAAILERARVDRRVVVTLDRDFPAELAATGRVGPSVILIRQQRIKGEDLVEMLTHFDAAVIDALERGAVVTIKPGNVRVRKLPISAAGGDDA